MAPADDADGILADLIGRSLDEHAPVLIVRSARRLGPGNLADVEERELAAAGAAVLEVVTDYEAVQPLSSVARARPAPFVVCQAPYTPASSVNPG